MKNSVKGITLFLGSSMFAFGTLKFIDPFKSWYETQVQMSELPLQKLSYWAGQFGEILIGISLILLVVFRKKGTSKFTAQTFIFNHVIVVIMMLVAFYVHLHPSVPNEVLPLKIKPPFVPAFFLILAVLNIWLERKSSLSVE